VLERLGGGIEVDVKGGAAVELEMGDEGGAKGGLPREMLNMASLGGPRYCETT